VSQQMKLSITRMIYNFKYHLTAEMMLFILVQYGWALQLLNQQELCLILVQSIWLSLLSSVMTKQPETINLKSMILFRVVSSKEINNIEDAKPWLTICISLSQIKYYRRQAQNWRMVLLNYKDLFGKIIRAYKH